MPSRRPFRDLLAAAEAASGSVLCVGLDPEPERFPAPWTGRPEAIFEFCAAIVDATKDLVLAYKPQIAHFSACAAEPQLERLIGHIREVAPGVPVLLDAKRGDIGSTAAQYAREAFVRYDADAVTVSPYLGLDSFEPYLEHPGRGVFLLCRTSNQGGADLQGRLLADGTAVYEHVAALVGGPWAGEGRVGMVAGSTWPGELARIRELAPTAPLLVPGVGAQGGDAAAAVAGGHRVDADGTTTGPVLVSSSRAVLYASSGADFAEAARAEALATRERLLGAPTGG